LSDKRKILKTKAENMIIKGEERNKKKKIEADEAS